MCERVCAYGARTGFYPGQDEAFIEKERVNEITGYYQIQRDKGLVLLEPRFSFTGMAFL